MLCPCFFPCEIVVMKRFVSVTACLIHNNYQSESMVGECCQHLPFIELTAKFTQTPSKVVGERIYKMTENNYVIKDGLSQAVTHSGEGPQQRRDIEHVLVKNWPIVNDAGPTLKQHKGNVTCLLGGGGGECSWRQSQCYYTARWGGDRPYCVYTPTPNPPPPTTTCYSSHLLCKGSICSLVKCADTVGQP